MMLNNVIDRIENQNRFVQKESVSLFVDAEMCHKTTGVHRQIRVACVEEERSMGGESRLSVRKITYNPTGDGIEVCACARMACSLTKVDGYSSQP